MVYSKYKILRIKKQKNKKQTRHKVINILKHNNMDTSKLIIKQKNKNDYLISSK